VTTVRPRIPATQVPMSSDNECRRSEPRVTALGFLYAGIRRGRNVHFVSHNWVALAVDRDDPVQVTILHDVVDRDGLDRDVAYVAGADELYGLSLERTPDGCHLCFHLEAEYWFTCRTVTCGTRYMTQSELDRLCALPHMSWEHAPYYRRAIAARQHLVAADPFTYQVEMPLSL
jgi:hypothetical protein